MRSIEFRDRWAWGLLLLLPLPMGMAQAMAPEHAGHGAAALASSPVHSMGRMQGGPAPVDAREPAGGPMVSGPGHHPHGHDMAPGRWGSLAVDRLEVSQSHRLLEGEFSHGDDQNRWVLGYKILKPDQGPSEQTWQLVWQRPWLAFWDVHVGGRVEDSGTASRQNWLVAGVSGVMPYHIDLAAQLRLHPDQQALEVALGYDWRLAQHWVLRPAVQLTALAHTVADRQQQSGLAERESSLQLRWELRRNLTPYIRWQDLRTPEETAQSWALGLAFWF